MSAIGDGFGLSARNRNRSGHKSERLQYYGSQNEVDEDDDDDDQIRPPKRNRIPSFSSKFYISLVLTIVIVISISQVFLFHYYFASNTNKFSNKTQNSAFELWHCLYPGLDDVFELAQKFGVDLVVVDPDLIGSLNIDDTNIVGPQTDGQVAASSQKQTPSFSEPSKRTNQETPYKTIVHFTAINETSGGQPSLKLFYNALKNNGYIILKYVDSSQSMQPEVYRRASHLFDDMPLDGVFEHKYSHDSNSQHNSMDYFTENHLDSHENEVSKIYTEFITHIFILNRTQPIELRNNKQLCINNQARFTVIHIFVLYNYEYDPSKQWIQPGLVMDEIDKHKLLSYNVHSFDFRIPIEQYYVHQKRKVIDLMRPPSNRKSRRKRSLDKIRILEPENGSLLTYANNSYVHCKKSQFNITGLIDNEKRISNYLATLDGIKPIDDKEYREFVVDQIVTALYFMDTFSKTYGNFSFWITGSSLLAYHKFCDLATQQTYDFEAGMNDTNKLGDNMHNLEIGLFTEEMNATMLDDLAKANNIGIVMMSDWRKSSTLISFQFRECPNVIFNLYLYELRKDFHQYYYITRSSMTMSHKFNKRPKTKRHLNILDFGHHVFNSNDLDLCWTCIEHLKPFRVPCNVYEHLRRIYII